MIIPGQSLTTEPKNAPYENPPEFTKPEDALDFHLDRLTQEDKVEALIAALELDFTVVDLTEGILRGAVMEGRHSVDVSLLIAPIIHEFIKSTADKVGIDYIEFEDDSDEKMANVRYQVNRNKARKILKDYEEDGEVDEPIEEDMGPVEEPEVNVEETPEMPKGLMARMSKLEGDM